MRRPASVVLAAILSALSALTVAAPAHAAGSPVRIAAGTTWQVQYAGRLDTARAQVVDVDGDATSAATVAALHKQGRIAVCYLSAGSWEDYRADAGAFPSVVVGRPLDGWPHERWLDVRRTDLLLPLMAARMDACAAKGFDAVDPDNVDGWSNETGFPLTATDQLAYDRALAGLAHARGLAVGLKNDVEQVAALAPSFDFAVNEQCAAYAECGAYDAFTRSGKAVVEIEYGRLSTAACTSARKGGRSAMLKHLSLDAYLHRC